MSDNTTIYYEKFLTSKQAAVRLSMALHGYFAPDGFSQEQVDAFGAYLKERIRPAAQSLLEQEAWHKLQILDRQGWLTGAVIEDLLTAAVAQKKTAAFLWLLQQKAETFGFSDRNWEL